MVLVGMWKANTNEIKGLKIELGTCSVYLSLWSRVQMDKNSEASRGINSNSFKKWFIKRWLTSPDRDLSFQVSTCRSPVLAVPYPCLVQSSCSLSGVESLAVQPFLGPRVMKISLKIAGTTCHENIIENSWDHVS